MGERVLMKGNEALAQAAIQAGCRHFFGYPITPQTEVAAYMSKTMPKIGGAYLQAESEIAAINMVLGAASAGVRAMTVLFLARHQPQKRGHVLHCGLRPALRDHQRAAGRPGPRRHPAVPGGLLAGHQGARPRRLPASGFRSLDRAGDGRPGYGRFR